MEARANQIKMIWSGHDHFFATALNGCRQAPKTSTEIRYRLAVLDALGLSSLSKAGTSQFPPKK